MKRHKTLVINLSVFLSAIITMSVTDPIEKTGKWEKIKTKDNVTVYSRENSLFDIDEVKAVTQINASLSALVYVIKRAEKQPQWAYSIIDARVVRDYNNFHWVTYNLSDAPWPVTNRDCVTDVKMRQLPDSTIIIKSVAIDSIVDKVEGVVRIPYVRAFWILKQRNKNEVDVTFRILVDVGGSVPAWVVNLFIENGPLNTLINFKKETQRDIYRGIKLPYIKEKR